MKEKHDPFIVPEGYFDSFTVEMMARIDAYEESKHKVQHARKISLSDAVNRMTRYVVGVAEAQAGPQPVDKSGFLQASAADQVYDYMDLNENNVYDYVSTID